MKIPSALAVLALAAGSVAAAAPAQAAPVSRDPYSGTDTFTECGFYAGRSVFEGTVTISDATPSTGGQFFRLTNKFSFTDTFTNPDTGDFITVTGNGVFKELQPRPQGGGIVDYVTHDVGRFVTRDSSGEVLARENGIIVTAYTFDTLNDSAPGGNGLSDELVRVSGPHPLFDVDFCDFLDEQIG